MASLQSVVRRVTLFTGCFFLLGSSASAQESERKLVSKVAPEYPAILKEKGIVGVVRLKVLVRPDGSVKQVDILGGNSVLADSAAKAVKQWRYAPADREQTIPVSVHFGIGS